MIWTLIIGFFAVLELAVIIRTGPKKYFLGEHQYWKGFEPTPLDPDKCYCKCHEDEEEYEEEEEEEEEITAMTWSEVQDAKKNFLLAVGYLPPDFKTPEWFKGVGIGFDIGDNNYLLRINVKEDADVAAAEDVLERMLFTGPYEIHAVGDILAL